MTSGPPRTPARDGDGNGTADNDAVGNSTVSNSTVSNDVSGGDCLDLDRGSGDRPQGPDAAGRPGHQDTADRPRARDRDAAGRPRNARPRDGLGRPLPRSAATGAERIPDDLEVGPAEAASLGGSLLAEGRPFHAHEVFEAAWKTGPPAERELWQGLAQVAVGITHARRGNPRGAVTLLRRGAERIRAYATAPDPDQPATDPGPAATASGGSGPAATADGGGPGQAATAHGGTPGQAATDPAQAATPDAAGRDGPHAGNRRVYGIDPGFVIAQAESIAAAVESRGLPALGEADLRFPLFPPGS